MSTSLNKSALVASTCFMIAACSDAQSIDEVPTVPADKNSKKIDLVHDNHPVTNASGQYKFECRDYTVQFDFVVDPDQQWKFALSDVKYDDVSLSKQTIASFNDDIGSFSVFAGVSPFMCGAEGEPGTASYLFNFLDRPNGKRQFTNVYVLVNDKSIFFGDSSTYQMVK